MITRTRRELQGTRGPTILAAHPITGSVVITVLTGLGLQLTNLIDFDERMSTVVGWTATSATSVSALGSPRD